jgi:methylenetetrahydrofolate dehydrogenase (NADP+) / methenyltetrahydrofolate cyclohydrolase
VPAVHPTTRWMDGTAVATRVLDETARGARAVTTARGRRPCLAAVLVGDDPSSRTYVRMKRTRCERVGVDSRLVELPGDTTTADCVAAVRAASADPEVDGILVQHPVPSAVDEREVFEAIDPSKDVDGVTASSFAAMALGVPGFVSCTPGGILRLLDAYDVSLDGAHAVVLGRSPILGRPMGMLLLNRDATVTYCHTHTRGLPEVVRSADVVVAAAGRPRLVRGDWVRRGAIVVDAGYHPGNVGDVATDEVEGRASLLTPVPGGVGPMTIAVLLEQTVSAAARGTEGLARRPGNART